MLCNTGQAFALLTSLDAPDKLLRHLRLVGEAADLLIGLYHSLGFEFDANLVQLGAAIHDAGKLLFPEELNGPGSHHEAAGYELMIAHDVQEEVARCCISHAAWAAPDVTFEELSVALADKLWKGKRDEQLELRVVDAIAEKLGSTRWQLFVECDSGFERIAAMGPERLARS